MDATYHRHDISDEVWALLELHLPGQRGQWGGIAEDNWRFINALFWVLRTGAPWRDLPPDYGKCVQHISALFGGAGKASGKNFWNF